MAQVVAIDPYDCGCTECLIGEYVPLANATAKQVRRMIKGKLRDNTGEPFTLTYQYKDGERWLETITAGYHEHLSWRYDS